MARTTLKRIMVAAVAIALAACGEFGEVGPGDSAVTVNAALEMSARPKDDRNQDPLRRPADVLDFIGVRPGMAIYEMEAGAGYYTELFARLVGPEGSVIMQNPAAFDSFFGEAVKARLAENRLPNVTPKNCSFDKLKAQDESADLVTWMLGPHELFFRPAGVETLSDPAEAFAEAYRILKPDGAFIIMDHAAAPGAPATTGNDLHRIDPAIVKALAAEAGFVLAEESDILRNPDDNYALSVFDPSVRRKTDRFLLKYRKP